MKLSSTKEITIKKPELPQVWNYQESIKKTKALVYKWKNINQELANELWIARTMLKDPGRRTDLSTKIDRLPTWKQYCLDIGSQIDVVNRWLIRWFPKERPKQELPPVEATEAMQFAVMAITNLERIREDDPKRLNAFKRVANWMNKNKNANASN